MEIKDDLTEDIKGLKKICDANNDNCNSSSRLYSLSVSL